MDQTPKTHSRKKKIVTYSGLFVAACFYVTLIIYIKTTFPNTQVFLQAVSALYETYGYVLVFFGALIESTFLIGLYFPGSAVVLLGAALSKTGILQFPLVILLGTIGLCIGYSINYFLGKHGWFHVLSVIGLEKGIYEAEKRLTKHTYKTIFLGYVNPGTASFISTASGVLKIPFKNFLIVSILSQSFWSLVWGSLAYFFGLPLIELFIQYFGYVIGIGIAILFLKRTWSSK